MQDIWKYLYALSECEFGTRADSITGNRVWQHGGKDKVNDNVIEI